MYAIRSYYARTHGCTAPAVALAALIRRGNVVAIPEAGDPEHVAANARALALGLTDDDLRAIDAAFPPPDRKHPLDIL